MNCTSIVKRLFIAGSFILAFVVIGRAAVPTSINYQGRVTDDSGQPIADDDYSFTFTIYDAPTAGDVKWTETQTVSTSAGLFAVLLGTVNPITDSVFNGTVRYLGIQLGAESELSPRTAIVSVPFAMQASYSDSTDAVTDGGIDLNDIGQNGASNGQTIKWNGSTWSADDDISGGAGWTWSDSSSYGPDSVGTAAGLVLPIALEGNSSNYIFDITNNGTGPGLVSRSLGSGGTSRGLYGHAENGTSSNQGVFGRAEGDVGGKLGVSGQAQGAGNNTGCYGLAEHGDFNYGFSGVARGTATNYGGQFKADSGTYNVGISGEAFGPGTNTGANSKAGGGEYNYAIYGTALESGQGSTGYNYGVYSRAEGVGFNYGLYATATGGHTNWAGFFDGDLQVKGNTTLEGNTVFKRPLSNNFAFEINTDDHRMNFYEYSSDFHRRLIEISAFSGGQIRLFYEADTSNALTELSGTPNGGEVKIRDQNGNTTIFMRGNANFANNDNVVLHEGSVDDIELMNEPGIAQDKISSCHTITSINTMEDVLVVSITTPAPGYVFLNGHGLVELSGTTNAHRIKAQIDETEGGSPLNGYYSRVGLGGYVSAASSAFSDFDLNCQRTYYKDSAGTFTFRMEATKESDYSAKICFATLTATYFPTSYGTVAAVAQGSGGMSPAPDVDTPTSGLSRPGTTVDLREREIEVREARKTELQAGLNRLQSDYEQ